jgi:acetoin utilization protein AcuB
MLVRDRMANYPITIRPDASVPDALKVMQGSKVRQLPVMSEKGELCGIVSLVDLFRVSPSPATSLSVWEVDYLLEKITVEKVMTRDVITVTEDTAVEEAGRIMAANKVSGLPVLRDGELVGIITETHLFNLLLELFGARESGVRVIFTIPEIKGTFAKITAAVSALGGTFVAFGEAGRSAPGERTVTVKVQDVGREELLEAIRPLVLTIEDVRET